MKIISGFTFFILLFALSACKKDDKQPTVYDNGPTDSLKINETQIIASHNSYHKKTDEDVIAFLFSLDSLGLIPSSLDPAGIDYTHLPFDEQFNNYNVRGLEIDIYNDPLGNQYFYRAGKSLIGKSALSNIDDLKQPGMKVLHIPDFDYNTNYYTFRQALMAVRDWSNAHPNHLPLYINIETKEETVAQTLTGVPGLTQSIPFDDAASYNIDFEIKDVFGLDLEKVITPDKIRGSFPTLREAALARNWPTLAQARGKIFFIMQGAAENEYLNGHPALQGRAMFVYTSDPTDDYAAFIILNNSVSSKTRIQQRVTEGFMVRTRADENTDQARSGDYTDMNAAFESGAQIISTDYYKADARSGTPGWTDYHVQFPDNLLSRINPISAAGKQSLGTIKE